ncbi:MAG: DUF3040 domain-containing protein [Bifidobacteriaceae bacterium]|nr:DUF3040 domain-containing protein [Bifidobacteriaceae bacterium]
MIKRRKEEVTAVPLSEYEQRVLDQLEAQLASEDPALGSRMASPASPRRGRVALGASAVAVGLAILVLGMVISQLWVSLIGFLAMFGGAYFALTSPKTNPLAEAPAAPKKRSSGKSRLSERFDKRLDDQGGGL